MKKSVANDITGKPLGMAWYKFLIYFSLFAGAILNIIYGVFYITGVIYTSETNGAVSAEQVYNYYGAGLLVLNIFYGLFLIAFAIFAIVLRSKLATFASDALKFVKIFYSLAAGVPFLYAVLGTTITGEALDNQAVVSEIVGLVFLLLNIRYFKRRAHLFVGEEYMPDDPNRVIECKSCGYRDEKYFNACPKCGKYAKQYVYLNEEPAAEANKISFCRKCGNKLSSDRNECDQCGTEIIKQESEIQEEIPFNNEEYEASKLSLNKKKRKKIFIILMSILCAAILVVAGLFVSKFIVKPQDINTINGCPEFYNLDWQMSQYDVDESVKLTHTFIPTFPKLDSSYNKTYESDASFYIDEGETFYLYGKKTEYVYISFEEECLDMILFTFSKDKYSLDNIVALYKKIYGPATKTNTTSSTWVGKKTTIDVLDYTFDDGENAIVVRYSITPNNQYRNLSFDGSEIDPCGFLDKNNIFNKEPEYYTNGLKEDEDYTKKFYSLDNFSGFMLYTLYPSFEYMGIPQGYTAIEFNVTKGEDTIGSVSYNFILVKENVVDRLDYIKTTLEKSYGKFKTCTYTSTVYGDNVGIKNISFETLKSMAGKATQGMYHIQWESEGCLITLGLTISVDQEYFEGSVAFSN